MIRIIKKLVFVVLLAMISLGLDAYPIDGYALTGIRRLLYLQMVMKGELKANLPAKGGQHSINDINALKNAIEIMISDENLYKKMTADIKSLYNRDRFNWNIIAKQTISVYRKICG